MTHYLTIAIALIQVIAPWAALFVLAMSIAAVPDLLTRYRVWRRRRIFTSRSAP